MGVGEFLNYVVPSNTLDSEQFRLRCLDVMQGSVRRSQQVESDTVSAQLQHHTTIRSASRREGG